MNESKNHKTYLFHRAIEYTDVDLLSQYINEQGKIMPRRITGLSAKNQKQITKSIKRARILSLISFSSK